MDALAKLKTVAAQMHLELAEEVKPHPPSAVAPCGQVVPPPDPQARKNSLGVFNAVIPGGKTIPLLKTLLTSACERNCYYCPFRAGRRYRRTTFKPEEMAKTFMDMHRAGLVSGLFLSSGIIGGGVRTQDKLLQTADILRHTHQFRGFLHLKIMPGAEQAQVERAMQLADRLSINLEAPTEKHLQALAPHKSFVSELLQPLQWIEQIRQQNPIPPRGHKGWPSTTTQFVVGGTDESDVELLQLSEYLYKTLRLGRTYFSAFSPIRDTPLENRPAEHPLRQHRLYQASFLFRDYGFNLEEMPFNQAGNLPLDTDPKAAWAQVHLSEAPVEVNRAGLSELLRVPGIGPKGAQAILAARRRGKLRDLQELQAIGVATKRVAPFVLLDGKRPSYQLRLL